MLTEGAATTLHFLYGAVQLAPGLPIPRQCLLSSEQALRHSLLFQHSGHLLEAPATAGIYWHELHTVQVAQLAARLQGKVLNFPVLSVNPGISTARNSEGYSENWAQKRLGTTFTYYYYFL